MIPWGAIGQFGTPGVLLAAVVWMIFTGRLVPRSVLMEAREQRDKWEQVARTAMAQNQELLTGVRVTHDVIKALPEATAGEPA